VKIELQVMHGSRCENYVPPDPEIITKNCVTAGLEIINKN
jgi:hypothetical protein